MVDFFTRVTRYPAPSEAVGMTIDLISVSNH